MGSVAPLALAQSHGMSVNHDTHNPKSNSTACFVDSGHSASISLVSTI